ncbi:MAG: glycosyl transferase family 28 [Muribaculaceae bacterium]|nr:glycosyl transferase family 28 [Muribaculaceae bacterium]
MIFVTIGTQAPFDRLIKELDDIAADSAERFVAQVAHGGTYTPRHMETVDFLPAEKFQHYFDMARVIVSHAGMGTIISALSSRKPIIVVPRLAELGEHRNNHQVDSAKAMKETGMVYAPDTFEELRELLSPATRLKPLRCINSEGGRSIAQRIITETFF